MIVAVCGLTLFVAFGIRLSFTVFFVALLDEFGWPRANTSLIFSVSMAVFTLFSTFAGIAMDKWGVRRIFGGGLLLVAVGLVLSSRIQTLAQLTISYGVITAMGITVLGLGPQASLIARWFRRQRGLAIGLAFAGTGIGTLTLTPGAEYLVSTVGWRTAYLTLAGLALLTIPVVLLLRISPNLMGLFPDGDAEDVFEWSRSWERPSHQWTIQEASQTPAFWLVIVAGVGAIGPLRMLTVHQLAIMTDAGAARLLAATMIGVAGAITAVSFILWGTLSDRIGRRRTYLIGSLCLTVAILILGNLQSFSGTRWLVAYAIMLGLGEGSRASLVTAVASDLFPGNAVGAINGAVGSAFGFGAAVFPWIAGRIYDVNGDYLIAFRTAVFGIILSALALWFAPGYLPSTVGRK